MTAVRRGLAEALDEDIVAADADENKSGGIGVVKNCGRWLRHGAERW